MPGGPGRSASDLWQRFETPSTVGRCCCTVVCAAREQELRCSGTSREPFFVGTRQKNVEDFFQEKRKEQCYVQKKKGQKAGSF
jgi:hypothetical protein